MRLRARQSGFFLQHACRRSGHHACLPHEVAGFRVPYESTCVRAPDQVVACSMLFARQGVHEFIQAVYTHVEIGFHAGRQSVVWTHSGGTFKFIKDPIGYPPFECGATFMILEAMPRACYCMHTKCMLHAVVPHSCYIQPCLAHASCIIHACYMQPCLTQASCILHATLSHSCYRPLETDAYYRVICMYHRPHLFHTLQHCRPRRGQPLLFRPWRTPLWREEIRDVFIRQHRGRHVEHPLGFVRCAVFFSHCCSHQAHDCFPDATVGLP